jgi:hypothetical protein
LNYRELDAEFVDEISNSSASTSELTDFDEYRLSNNCNIDTSNSSGETLDVAVDLAVDSKDVLDEVAKTENVE